MLKQIKVIQGVGSFVNFRSNKTTDKTIEFNKNTIVYALNGYGKSTIATILKSLNSSDSTKIVERLSLQNETSTTHKQEILIEYHGGGISRYDKKWRHSSGISSPPKILVFDQQFVFENLFLQKVESSHKKSIHKIIIGADGLEISKKLTVAKENAKHLKGRSEQKKLELNRRERLTGRTDYISIQDTEKDDMENDLNKIIQQITAKKESEKLYNLTKIPALVTLDFDFNSLYEAYRISLGNVHKKAEQLIQEHIKQHMGNPEKAESFLQSALDQMVDTCPYCGQDIHQSAISLIEAYQQHFDGEYTRVTECISETLSDVRDGNITADVLRISKGFDRIKNALAEFKEYVEIDVLDPFDFDKITRDSEKFIVAISNTLEKKQKNISFIPPVQTIECLKNQLSCFNDDIKKVNQKYEQAKNKISAYLSEISVTTSDSLDNRKEQLENCLKRFSDNEDKWCRAYKVCQSDYLQKQKTVAILTSTLSEYSEQILKGYQKDINQTLLDLGADFRLGRLTEQVDNRSKQPFVDFCIMINDTHVPLQVRGDKPSFQNTLSEGEKNTLSLAFFISWVKKQSDLDQKIIVFDDPLSSLDSHRKNLTSRVIRNLSKSVGQIIILTHNEDFLLLVHDKLSSPKVLSLKKDRKNGSRLIGFDMAKQRKDPQQIRIEELEKYLDEDYGSVSEAQGKIRLCLETALRFKYYRRLSGETTLGSVLGKLKEAGKLDNDLLGTLYDLNKISAVVHHGEQGKAPLKEITRDELLPDVRRTLDILEKI